MRPTLLALALALTGVAGQGLPAPKPITVSAAVSLTDALTAIATEYANAGRGAVRFNFGASNVLARQIVGGAPVDLFISADAAQMDLVGKAGLILEGTRFSTREFFALPEAARAKEPANGDQAATSAAE